MTQPLRTSLATLLVPALAPGLLLAGLPAARAEAPRPTELTLRDPVETRASHDVRRVRLYSGSAQDPAAVAVTFARRARTGDKVKVWFDLDRDRRPEFLAKVVVDERLRCSGRARGSAGAAGP